MTRCVILLILLLVVSCSEASQIRPLKVGEKVPSEILQKIYRNVEGGMKEAEGKYLILQFWNHTCAASAKAIPVMEQLQKRFPDRLKIILVNNTDSGEPSQAYYKANSIKPPDLLKIYGLHELSELFPHSAVPFLVWVSDKGELLARTSSDYANTQNIERVIAGEKVQMHEFEYEEEVSKYKTLLVQDPEVLDTMPLYYSAITRMKKGGGAGISNFKGSHLLYNQSVESLYSHAFEIPMELKRSMVVYEVPDSIRKIIKGPDKGTSAESLNRYNEWREEYSFCYNSYFNTSGLPQGWKLTTDRRESMRVSLNEYFGLWLGIEGKILKRDIPCMVISKANEKSKGTAGEASRTSDLKRFATMVEREWGVSVILADNVNPYLEVKIPANLSDLKEVRDNLRKQGYYLNEKTVEKEVLVFRLKGNGE